MNNEIRESGEELQMKILLREVILAYMILLGLAMFYKARGLYSKYEIPCGQDISNMTEYDAEQQVGLFASHTSYWYLLLAFTNYIVSLQYSDDFKRYDEVRKQSEANLINLDCELPGMTPMR